MALYPAPNPKLPIYNPTAYHVDTGNTIGIDEQFLSQNYLQFPLAQGTENFGDIFVGNDETISGNLILDGTFQTNYIQFPDGSQQFSASVGDGSAFLNGGISLLVPQTFTGYNLFNKDLQITAPLLINDNIILDGVANTNYIQFPDGTKQYSADTGNSPYSVLYNQSNTYDSGFIQTFTANSETETGLTAPIVFTNTTTSGGIGSLFIDPDNNKDITLYSNQSSGAGLTVRNPTNSFTVNPDTINSISNTANFINPINCTSNISTQGVLQVYDGSTFTNNTTIDQQADNLVISNNSSGGAIVLNQVGATNPQVLISSDAGTIVQNALYIKNPSNQNLFSSIGQGDNLSIFNQCASGLNSNILFQLNNPVSGQPVVQPLRIYSTTCDFLVPINNYSTMPSLTDKSTLVPTTTWINDCIDSNLLPYAPLASPTFTGNPQAPTPATSDNDTSIATTAYVKNNLVSYAPLDSPTFTGNPQAPTPLTTDNDTSISTTAYVKNNLVSYALINSPNLTGTPTISTTPLIGQTTAIANVDYVNNAVAGAIPILTNYAQLSTGTSQTFTGPNIFTNLSTSITRTNYISLPLIANVTSFSYIQAGTTTTYSYVNSNTNYTPKATLTITNLGVKRFTFCSSYNSDDAITNNLFVIDNPRINVGGVINYSPNKIVIASWEITSIFSNYDWSFTYSQPLIIYNTQGTQACFIIAQLVTAINNPTVKYYLEVSINCLAQNVNLFNNSTYYNINGFSFCWT